MNSNRAQFFCEPKQGLQANFWTEVKISIKGNHQAAIFGLLWVMQQALMSLNEVREAWMEPFGAVRLLG